MFAILVPAALMPLILTLFWGERQAKKLGLVPSAHPHDDLAPPGPVHKSRFVESAWMFAEQLDLVGLLMLGTAVSLILIPMTLVQRDRNSWSSRTFPIAFASFC